VLLQQIKEKDEKYKGIEINLKKQLEEKKNNISNEKN